MRRCSSLRQFAFKFCESLILYFIVFDRYLRTDSSGKAVSFSCNVGSSCSLHTALMGALKQTWFK
jgi:hypothetical protein